jgi:hypothetical protein
LRLLFLTGVRTGELRAVGRRSMPSRTAHEMLLIA